MTEILLLATITMSAMFLVTAGCALWLDRNETGRLVEWRDRGGSVRRRDSRTRGRAWMRGEGSREENLR